MKNLLLMLCLLPLLVVGCDSDQPADSADSLSQQDTSQAAPEAVTAAETETAEADRGPSSPEPAPTPEASVASAEVQPVEAPAMSGEQVFKKYCMACHMTGAANAPRVGDAEAWAPRIEKGMDALLMSAVNGVPNTAMPPAGTCTSCTEEELQAAIEFMVNQSR